MTYFSAGGSFSPLFHTRQDPLFMFFTSTRFRGVTCTGTTYRYAGGMCFPSVTNMQTQVQKGRQQAVSASHSCLVPSTKGLEHAPCTHHTHLLQRSRWNLYTSWWHVAGPWGPHQWGGGCWYPPVRTDRVCGPLGHR